MQGFRVTPIGHLQTPRRCVTCQQPASVWAYRKALNGGKPQPITRRNEMIPLSEFNASSRRAFCDAHSPQEVQ